jgi:hypothetical protein
MANKPKSPFDDDFDGSADSSQQTSSQPVVPVVQPPMTQAPAPAAANPPLQLGSDAVSQLLQYLIMKEGREAKAAQESEERRKSITAQRERNAKDQDSKRLLKQARCKHLKGGKRGPKGQHKDYAVYQHRFIAFNDCIRCRVCGMQWLREDTVDYLVRTDKRGKKVKIANHTHKGWREAMEMCDQSTDTMSASESLPNVAPNATYVDAAGLPVQGQIRDKDTGELIEGVSI